MILWIYEIEEKCQFGFLFQLYTKDGENILCGTRDENLIFNKENSLALQ